MKPFQLYDLQGRSLSGKGANRDEVFAKGLLHGASHVWIYRINNKKVEVLLQKRLSTKKTWPNKLDISAAGHIDLGEEPTDAAIREVKEEIGLSIIASDLSLTSVQRVTKKTPNNLIENEFCWVYILKLEQNVKFTLQPDEVDSVSWIDFDKLHSGITDSYNYQHYVPQGQLYYLTVFEAIKIASA